MTTTASDGAAAPGPPGYDELVERMLDEAREEVTRADAKASILLALYVALEVVLFTALASKTWTPGSLVGGWELLFWLGWVTSVVGLVLVAIAVYPRVGNKHDECITYHGHVAACESIGEMQEGLRAAATMDPTRHEEQLWTVSGIARVKYQHIARSMWFFFSGATACAIAIAGNTWAPTLLALLSETSK